MKRQSTHKIESDPEMSQHIAEDEQRALLVGDLSGHVDFHARSEGPAHVGILRRQFPPGRKRAHARRAARLARAVPHQLVRRLPDVLDDVIQLLNVAKASGVTVVEGRHFVWPKCGDIAIIAHDEARQDSEKRVRSPDPATIAGEPRFRRPFRGCLWQLDVQPDGLHSQFWQVKCPAADALVSPEGALLEADHSRCHTDVTQPQSAAPPGAFLGITVHREPGVSCRRQREVPNPALAHMCDAGREVKRLNQVGLTVKHVYRTRVKQVIGRPLIRRGDDLVRVQVLNSVATVGHHPSQPNLVCRVHRLAPVPPAVSLGEFALVSEDLGNCAQVFPEESGVISGQRQFRRRAPDVIHEHVRVIVPGECVLVGFAEQEVRVVHDVLIHRSVACDQDRECIPVGSPGPTSLLPCAGDSARIAHDQARIKAAHVDAQFQRICGRDASDLPAGEPGFNLPPFRRQVAGAVRCD